MEESRGDPASAAHSLDQRLPRELLQGLLAAAKPKPRSAETNDRVHGPELANLGSSVQCLLLGDSMFERFKTTGKHTSFGPPAGSSTPSPVGPIVGHPDDGAEIAAGAPPAKSAPATISPSYQDPSTIPSYSADKRIFNAGCGGDTIKNIIFRLTKKNGLLEHLVRIGGAQHIFIMMGTNDLGDGKRSLSDENVILYRSVLEVLVLLFPNSAISVCGLNPKKRVKRQGVIEESNEKLERMVREFSRFSVDREPSDSGMSPCRVAFLTSQPSLIDHLEADGVHLDEEGYSLFAETLEEHYKPIGSLL